MIGKISMKSLIDEMFEKGIKEKYELYRNKKRL